MTTLQDVARDFSAMILAGRFEEAAEKYWADDVTIMEPANLPDGTPAVVRGLRSARARLTQWLAHSAMDDLSIDGPFVTGDQFALFIDTEIMLRETGARRSFSEIAVYTVRNGKIIEERYFYS